METKAYKPIVLVANKSNGAAIMFGRRYWESRDDTKYDKFQVIAFADTPEEKATLWEIKNKLNYARKSN